MALGTAVMILDPLSILRFSATISDTREIRGIKLASCDVEVKMTNPEAIVNEVTLDDSVFTELVIAYRLPESDRPMYTATSCTDAHCEEKQNSGNFALDNTMPFT
jgi:hypothetical protein